MRETESARLPRGLSTLLLRPPFAAFLETLDSGSARLDDVAMQQAFRAIVEPLPLEFPHDAPRTHEAAPVAPDVLWVRLPLPFALDHVNVWLLRDGQGWTLVDTGIGSEITRTVWTRVFGEALQGQPIVRVIATHCHPDHVGLAHWLVERFGCPLWMTQGEYLNAHALWNDVAGYGATPLGALFARHGLGRAQVEAQVARGNMYRRAVPAIPTNYRRMIDGEHIRIGAHDWRVIVGYGHSAEHAALYCADASLLISGDMLLPKISTNVSVWPPDPDADPVRLFLDSIARFSTLSAATLVLPSHGLPFRGMRGRIVALENHHAARLGELLQAASVPLTAAEVLPVLFRRTLDAQQLFFAMGEAIAHLNHLYYRAELRRITRDDGVVAFIRNK